MAACPYNARVFNWSEPDHDPDNEPMCVVCCPSSERAYGDLDAPNSEISKIGQQVFGLGITGMSNGTSWGLYICLFLLYLSALCGKAAAGFAEGDEAVRPVANKDAWQCHPFRTGGMARCKTCNANCMECNDSPACSAV